MGKRAEGGGRVPDVFRSRCGGSSRGKEPSGSRLCGNVSPACSVSPLSAALRRFLPAASRLSLLFIYSLVFSSLFLFFLTRGPEIPRAGIHTSCPGVSEAAARYDPWPKQSIVLLLIPPARQQTECQALCCSSLSPSLPLPSFSSIPLSLLCCSSASLLPPPPPSSTLHPLTFTFVPSHFFYLTSLL